MKSLLTFSIRTSLVTDPNSSLLGKTRSRKVVMSSSTLLATDERNDVTRRTLVSMRTLYSISRTYSTYNSNFHFSLA